MIKKGEILAPAGNIEALKSAVNGGANAVYLGFGQLNARRNATGFTDETLEEAIRYCKSRDVKVYITLNTCVFDNELEQAKKDIIKASNLGVDAFIIQDLSVYKLVKEIAPSVHLHGSTQMAVHNVSGAKILKEMGFNRVVLAREMSKEEIKSIIENVAIETEVFVHGALCMCVSGQCYISSMIGQRSGNRGLCAQPCRLPFRIEGTGCTHAMSLKDLSIIDKLGELEEIGVTSFKIEGRMKRPEYVYTAVNECANSLEDKEIDHETLKAVFARSGFTSGYYDSKLGKDMFGTRQKQDVTSAQKVLKTIANQMVKENPKIRINMEFILKKDKPAFLKITDGKNSVTKNGDIPEIAINKPTTEEMVVKSLSKIGGTFYNIGNIFCDIDDGLILPVSKINILRRECIEQLNNIRNTINKKDIHDYTLKILPNINMPSKQTLRADFVLAEQIPQEYIEKLEKIILPINEIQKAVSLYGDDIKDKLVVKMPRVTFGDDRKFLYRKLKDIKEMGIKEIITSNIGFLQLGKELEFKVHGDFGLNITNTLSFEQYEKLGLCDAVLSYELNISQANTIGSNMKKGIIAYGSLPLMVTRNCPLKNARDCKDCTEQTRNIIDRKDISFHIKCSKTYVEVLNSVPLYLADRLSELRHFDFLNLMFTNESKDDCKAIINEYINGGKRSNITRGLYYRNVL